MDGLARAQLLRIPARTETGRMILRAVTANDGPLAFEAALELVTELSPWMPWIHPEPTLLRPVDFHATAQFKWATREIFDFRWIDKVDGNLIGKGGLHPVNWEVPKFEIGYWVRTSMANRGCCTEAVNALVQLSKHQMGARRIKICSDPRNTMSGRVAKRCGFKLKGILRQNMRAPLDKLRDSCVYAPVFK